MFGQEVQTPNHHCWRKKIYTQILTLSKAGVSIPQLGSFPAFNFVYNFFFHFFASHRDLFSLENAPI